MTNTKHLRNDQLYGKRLLILGGSLWKESIKRFCDDNGVTIIAAGNNPNAGICDIADTFFNVNSTDQDEMKKLIINEKIDGVYLGGSEPVIEAGCQYVNELGLPCYCNYNQWRSLQNKLYFKSLCEKFGLPTVCRYELNEIRDNDFPLITKPADGCGSNGFSVCRNRCELQNGYNKAENCSETGNVIIESFVPNNSVVAFYTVCDGELFFSTLEDKYPVYFHQYGTYVGGLFDFESNLSFSFRDRFEEKIQSLVSFLGIQSGNFWIEVFYDDNKYFFNEAGFRYGGSGSIYPIDYFRGINQVSTDIYFSLTGHNRIKGFVPLYGSEVLHRNKYAVYPIYVKEGTIKEINGIHKLCKVKNILTILTMKKAGDTIIGNGSFGQVTLLVHFVYDDIVELRSVIQSIHEHLSVLDESRNDMILTLLNTEELELRS